MINLKATLFPPLQSSDNMNHIKIWESQFTDDIWDCSLFMPTQTSRHWDQKLTFTNIHSDEIKMLLKQYAYFLLGTLKPRTVCNKLNCFSLFLNFAQEHGINSFKSVTYDIFQAFNNTLVTLCDGGSLTSGSAYQRIKVVEEVITIGQVNRWEVPMNIKLKGLSWQFWKKRYRKTVETNKHQPIPPIILNKILHAAKEKERNAITRAGIIIQSQTGLRISEVLSLKVGCLRTSLEGTYYLEVPIQKTRKDVSVTHKVYCNDWVAQIIGELQAATAELRRYAKSVLQLKIKKLSDSPTLSDAERNSAIAQLISKDPSNYLFLKKIAGNKIVVPPAGKWTTHRLKSFVVRWDITDKNGNLYPLSSHQFRATYVRELIKKNVPLAIIMKHFAHVSIEMTNHYHTINDQEIKKDLGERMLHPESKIAGKQAMQIKDRIAPLFEGKTKTEINEVVSELSSSMFFNTLPTGICIYDARRGHCSDGDGCFFYNCPNYLTSIEFFPILKQELRLLEAEMARYKQMGRERDWQRQFIKWQHLKPLVKELEVQLDEQ